MDTSAGPDAGLERLLQRYSVGPKHLRHPVPGDDELSLAALAALRAPDHAKLTPYAFVLLQPSQRPLLAELFAAVARREGRSEAEIEVERDRALRAPMLIAFSPASAKATKRRSTSSGWPRVGPSPIS